MFIKKLTLNLLLVMPVFSFAAISAQDIANFKSTYGGEINPKTYANILMSCDKNDTDIDSCLRKLKAQPSKLKSPQGQMNYKYCCVNVSGRVGEYAYIHGQDYCIPPC